MLALVMGPVWLMRVHRHRREERRLRALEVAHVDDMSVRDSKRHWIWSKLDRAFRPTVDALDVVSKINKKGKAVHSITEKAETRIRGELQRIELPFHV